MPDSWFGRHHPAWELRTGDFAEVTAHCVEASSVNRIVLNMLAPVLSAKKIEIRNVSLIAKPQEIAV